MENMNYKHLKLFLVNCCSFYNSFYIHHTHSIQSAAIVIINWLLKSITSAGTKRECKRGNLFLLMSPYEKCVEREQKEKVLSMWYAIFCKAKEIFNKS